MRGLKKPSLITALLVGVLLLTGSFAFGGESIAKASDSLLFSDNFNRRDGLVASETMANASSQWRVTSGNLYIRRTHGYTNDDVFRVVTRRSDFSDVLVSAYMQKRNLAVNPWEGLQLFIRYQDPDNLYVAGLRNDNSIHLKKKIKGKYVTLATAPINSNMINTWYKMTIVADSDRLRVFVGDKKYIDVRDASLTAGRVGIRTDNIEAYFDNFQVSSR